MNFLELCQMAHRYISGGNQPPGTAPLSVQNQQGELYSIVKSIQEAYVDIQTEQQNWLFMMKSASILLPVGAKSISRDTIRKTAGLTDYQRIMPLLGNGSRYISIYDGGIALSTTPSPVVYIPYQQWRGLKDQTPIRNGKPAYFTIMPDETIAFDATPQSVYTLNLDYRVRPYKLTVDTDEPVWDEDFHTAVAWRAVNLWGGRQTDQNKFAFAGAEYNRVMSEMRGRYLPEMVFSVGEYSGQSILTS
jgi:hypothetical protein